MAYLKGIGFRRRSYHHLEGEVNRNRLARGIVQRRNGCTFAMKYERIKKQGHGVDWKILKFFIDSKSNYESY